MLVCQTRAVCATALSVLAGTACGQYDWVLMASSTWNNGAAWAGPVSPAFPNSDSVDATIATPGVYTVSVSNGNWAVNNVIKSNPNATLQLNRTLQVYGSVVNEGPITIAAPPGGGANLRFRGVGARSITGTGLITLASNATSDQSATIDRSAFDTTVVTFSPGQTITGTGRLTCPFVNQGLISAAGGIITINSADNFAINNGAIEATGGGTIRLTNVTLDCQNVGTITIDNSTLEFNGQTFMQRIKDATITTPNGGLLRAIQGNCELEDVILNGNADGDTRVGYRFFGSFFENNGTVTLTGDGVNGFSALRTGSTPYTFAGTGEMILASPPMTNPGAVPTINALAAGHVLTNAPNHTIRGAFRVVHEMVNQGTMVADQTDQAVSLITLPMNNQGVLRATNGGIIYINNDTTQTGAGVIQLNAGFLDALPIGGDIASLTGNSIEGLNGGKMRLMDGNLEVTNVTLNCDADILGQQFRSVGGNVNNGSMLLQLDGGNFGVLQFDAPQTWGGTGEIVLNADNENVLRYARITRTNPGDEIVHAATHTIRGTGEVFAALDNRGLITADVPDRTISLLTENKKNSGVIRANTGRIQIFSIEIDQTAGPGTPGLMQALAGGEFTFESATIIGGEINVAGGSALCASGINRFDSIEFDGTMNQITSGNEILGSIVNNGLWVINTPRANLRVLDLGPGCVIGGTGRFRLNSPGTSSSAQIVTTTNQIETVTHGINHTIEGEGGLTRLNMLNQGTLSPGFDGVNDPAVGVFELIAGTSITCTPTSTVAIEVAGTAAANHDRIVNIGALDTSFHCAGTLALSNINGFGGLGPGEFIDIIVAPVGVTGEFDTVTYPGAVNYEVLYLPDRVRLAFACRADTNNDGTLSPADFNAWILAFNNQSPACDQNGDGLCDPSDFNAWILNFNNGC